MAIPLQKEQAAELLVIGPMKHGWLIALPGQMSRPSSTAFHGLPLSMRGGVHAGIGREKAAPPSFVDGAYSIARMRPRPSTA